MQSKNVVTAMPAGRDSVRAGKAKDRRENGRTKQCAFRY